jgi:hypothetical protein
MVHRRGLKKRSWWRQKLAEHRGDTMLTAVLAAAFVGLAAAASGSIVKMMRKESIFANVNSSSLSVESSILLALQSPDTYSPATAALMRKGGEDLVKDVEIRDENGVVAKIGGTVHLDGAGKACTPSSDKPCAMKTNLRIDCVAGGSCKAAYQIAFDPSYGRKPAQDGSADSGLPPLGSEQWPPRPGTSDFSNVISYDLFRRVDGKNICAPNELFVSGMDKSNGNVDCVLPSQLELQKNQIGQTVEYNSATHSVEIVPRTLAKLTCPNKYVLRIMDPSSLDETRTPQGTCVYRYKKEVPWMEEWPRGQTSVSGPFCPQEDYGVVPNGECTVNVTSRTDGVCPRTCCDGEGNCSDCSYTVPPNISYSVSQHFDARGPNVSCSFQKTGTQQCGASWEGEVVWSGRCKIYVPEHEAAGGAR